MVMVYYPSGCKALDLFDVPDISEHVGGPGKVMRIPGWIVL